MIRQSLKLLVVAIIASFALSSAAEAATKKNARARAKHSTHVSATGAPAAKAGVRTRVKKTTRKRAAARATGSTRSTTTGRKPAKKAAKHRSTTKPR